MLIPTTYRCIEMFGQFHRGVDGPANDHAGTIQHHREFGVAGHIGGSGNGIIATRWTFKFNDGWQLNIDHLCPVITWNIDLRRR